MSHAKLTQAQINILNAVKGLDDGTRKPVKKNLFALVKDALGIPSGIRLKAVIDNTASAEYGYLHTKDGQRLNVGADGKFNGTFSDKPVVEKFGYVKLAGSMQTILKGIAIDSGKTAGDFVASVPGISGTDNPVAGSTPVLTVDGNTYVLMSSKDFQ